MRVTAVVAAMLCLVSAGLASPLPQEGQERLFPSININNLLDPIVTSLLSNANVEALAELFFPCEENKSCIIVRNANLN
ncbi:hypothetical protein E2C01_029484 [Portunus trituberculatus]|uniref:Uncharacterized protein n=1 Tax=Portunus trituberculatus TaxID=210409 RepID=A0A5B7EN30_PORTR|nr:hypothetical protein [Portunus trituberculatus]